MSGARATRLAGAARGWSRYRDVLRAPGLAAALAASVVGRLHESMITFGVLLLVTTDGTYAHAGWVLAAYGAGGMVGAPVTARLADRRGHGQVLVVTAALHAGAVLAIAAGARPLALVAALAGCVTPPLTPALRSTLPRLAPAGLERTAFALESTVQELVFVAGPLVAGAAAALGGPRAALLVAAGTTLAGIGWYVLAVWRVGPGEPGAARSEAAATTVGQRSRGRLLHGEVLAILLGGVAFLAVLSVAAVGVVAAASGERARAGSGVLLGLTSLGSVVGGLVFGARTRPAPLPGRFGVLAGGTAALAAAAWLAGSGAGAGALGAVALAVAALVYGTTIAPVGTVLFGRLSEVAGTGRAAEAFGWMGAAMGVGGVLGDAGGGVLVTRSPVLALAVAAALAVGAAAVLRPRAAAA